MFARKGQIYGQTIFESCSTMMHHPTHQPWQAPYLSDVASYEDVFESIEVIKQTL